MTIRYNPLHFPICCVIKSFHVPMHWQIMRHSISIWLCGIFSLNKISIGYEKISHCAYIIIIIYEAYSSFESLRRRYKRPKYEIPFSIDYRERRSHARGVYPTQNTSRIGTTRVKLEKEADSSIIVKE